MAARRSRRALVTGLVCALLSVPVATHAAVVPATCGVVAHRGEHTDATENSTGSIRAALALPVDYIEFDVRAAQDGTLFLMHDRSVKRTTDGKGLIENKTRAQVRALRLDDGTRVPTLRRAFELAVDSTAHVLVELKRMGGDPTYRDLVDQVEAFGRHRVRVTSFRTERLDKVAALAPRIRLGVLTRTALPSAEVAPYDAVLVKHTSVTDEWLESMPHPVFVWTPSAPEWGPWVDLVRAVITDDVSGFLAHRASACAN